MQLFFMLLLTAVTTGTAAYAHYRIPYHTKTALGRWFLHIFLGVIGLAFAWVNSQRFPVTGMWEVLVFLSSFGVVHIPAAGILFIKRQQRMGS